MGKLYMMVGIPASGKSTACAKLDGTAVSSDLIREEYFGKADYQYTRELVEAAGEDWDTASFERKCQIGNQFVFAKVYERCRELLQTGNVILDATNHTAANRAKVFAELKDSADSVIAVYLTDSHNRELCFARNRERSRFVPEAIMERFYAEFEPPLLSEGFDAIQKFGVEENIM